MSETEYELIAKLAENVYNASLELALDEYGNKRKMRGVNKFYYSSNSMPLHLAIEEAIDSLQGVLEDITQDAF